MLEKTRKEAHLKNQKKYYTGKPCIKGHATYRYTASGACAACSATNSKNQFIRCTVSLVHQDDKEALNRYATALNNARKLDSK